MEKYKVIAIDGPAGAGKSTIAKVLAKTIGYTYIDSGAMYRAATLVMIRNNIELTNIKKLMETLLNSCIDFINENIYLNGENISKKIREHEVNKFVSDISTIPEVRKHLVKLQRKISEGKNIIMDGRDVGTVIFPNANLKLYITASINERAKRRYTEMKQNGYKADLIDICKSIEQRDYQDSNRATSPLKIADDSIYIDTTGKSVDEVVKLIILNCL